MLQKCGRSRAFFIGIVLACVAVWEEAWVISLINEIQITTIHEKSFKSMAETYHASTTL